MAQLTRSPSVNTGMLIRRCPPDAFEALADPAVTTRFWYTKSSGRMEQGAELTWEWEMYGVSGKVWVKEIKTDRRIRFAWEGYDPANPTTVECLFVPCENDTTYVASQRRISAEMLTLRSAVRSSPPPGSPFYSAPWKVCSSTT
jgi:uncharacterized protein YndB with AHSA1/START domain